MKGAWELKNGRNSKFHPLFQIKYKWPGTKVMEIDVAVPSHQLLLACRDKDAGLSAYICQICHNISVGSLQPLQPFQF